jgi:Tfp pilus assembly protein PilO
MSKLVYTILGALVLYFFAMPQYEALGPLNVEKQRYEDTLEQVRNIEQKKSELLAEYNQITKEEISNINSMIPTSENFVKLVTDIDATAQKSGIRITKATAKPGLQAEPANLEETLAKNPYNSSIVSLTFTAPYQTFKVFMGELEKSLRIIDTRTLKIVIPEISGTYTYNLDLETYWME